MIIDTDKVVRLADIARMAGVGPTAVSNWRDRHADFPKPVAMIPTWGAAGYGLELFDLAAIEEWLDGRERRRQEALEARESRLKEQLRQVRAARRKAS